MLFCLFAGLWWEWWRGWASWPQKPGIQTDPWPQPFTGNNAAIQSRCVSVVALVKQPSSEIHTQVSIDHTLVGSWLVDWEIWGD